MKHRFFLAAAIMLTLVFICASGQRVPPGLAPTGATPRAADQGIPESLKAGIRVTGDFGRMPLAFIANQGQVDRRAVYYVQGADKAVYFTREGLTYVLSRPDTAGKAMPSLPELGPALANHAAALSWTVKQDFVGANRNVRPVGLERTGTIFSYFRGAKDQWRTGIPSFSRILYPAVWPGIDLTYSGTTSLLKYEFVVKPGADPGSIRLAYRGATAVNLNQAGELEVETPAGGFRDAAPEAYQEIEGKRVPVSVSYALESAAPGSEAVAYGFRVADYDKTRPLVLDPAVIVYCGYVGGTSYDYAYGVAVDGNGAAYVTGETYGASGFPTAVGPDTSPNGNYDAFIAKLNSQGTGFLYCGFIGGSGMDRGAGVAVDANGNAYVIGQTQSSESTFPETVGPDLTYNGGWDVFVAKVNPTGSALVYCGYVGGSADDFPAWGGQSGSGIAVDASGNAYIAGDTSSTQASFPVTVGPDLTHNGDSDGFVAKINANGLGLAYCGYLGTADGFENIMGIAVDGSGSAYLVGYVYDNTTFPVTVGPDLTHNGSADAFIAKLSPAGTAWLYCGYIGGSDDDRGWTVAVDGAGCACVAGYTTSTESQGFPVTEGPDLTYNLNTDAFIAKVNPAGSGLVYCGYVGGNDGDVGRGIAVDKCANAFLVGDTSSTQATFPEAVGPDLTYNNNGDGFVVKVSSAISGKNTIAADIDGDGADEIVGDFDYQGLWYNDGGAWNQISGVNVENLAALDSDGDAADEIVGDFGPVGLWLWNAGIWTQLSGVNCDAIAAANIDGDVDGEIVGDFGPTGLWLWNSGAWTQLSGVNVEQVAALRLAGGSDAIVGDFGPVGLWIYSGGTWTILSGVNTEFVLCANVDGVGDEEVIGDFGALGLWKWQGSWAQISGLNPEQMIAADVTAGGHKEIFADFGSTGLWLWETGGWSKISSQNIDFMTAANIDGGGDQEIVADLGTLGVSPGAQGLWAFDGNNWSLLSSASCEYVLAADVDGNGTDELVVDLNYLGLWLRNAGVWTQLR